MSQGSVPRPRRSRWRLRRGAWFCWLGTSFSVLSEEGGDGERPRIGRHEDNAYRRTCISSRPSVGSLRPVSLRAGNGRAVADGETLRSEGCSGSHATAEDSVSPASRRCLAVGGVSVPWKWWVIFRTGGLRRFRRRAWASPFRARRYREAASCLSAVGRRDEIRLGAGWSPGSLPSRQRGLLPNASKKR